MKKSLTLCFVHTPTHILLGMKKAGFGAGRWNGFGGKVERGESIEEAAVREIKEEAGLAVSGLEKRGILQFEFEENPGEILEVHVFHASAFEGDLQETAEMRPCWFRHNEIPFHEMWPDDRYWMPLFLAGKNFEGHFLFRGLDVILSHDIREV